MSQKRVAPQRVFVLAQGQSERGWWFRQVRSGQVVERQHLAL